MKISDYEADKRFVAIQQAVSKPDWRLILFGILGGAGPFLGAVLSTEAPIVCASFIMASAMAVLVISIGTTASPTGPKERLAHEVASLRADVVDASRSAIARELEQADRKAADLRQKLESAP